MTATENSRLTGAQTRSGGATTPGPCPTCGHYGPRYVLCMDPDCRHEVGQHDIRKNGSRGACLNAGPRGVRCPCKAPVITELTTNGEPLS